MKYHIAVLDIGKTNKKLLIYDQELKIIDQKSCKIPEIFTDGIEQDDVESIQDWFIKEIRSYSGLYDIRVISISSHGATFVGLDEKGDLPIPVISYTHDPGDAFQQAFFSEFGHRDDLQRITATSHLGALINLGKNMYFQKEKFKKTFEKIETILYYPQYFGYWLTGKIAADITYTGCHTYLWDFQKNTYSSVARQLGVEDKLPLNVGKPFEVLGTIHPGISEEMGLDRNVIVTLGIHDSNSALLPYLITKKQDFILNSTGTWCVVMHNEGSVYFNEDEIGKTVFFNLSAFGDPVKTAIFMGGLEFESYDKILKSIHGDLPFPEFEPDLYQSVIDEKECFILPSVLRGSGQFPDSKAKVREKGLAYDYSSLVKGKKLPGFFHNFKKAYAVLNLSLALQTKVALDRVGMKKGIPIFIEGGFRHNFPYCSLITALYPDSEIYLTNLQEASAYGAAICAKAAMEKKHPLDLKANLKIESENIEPVQFKNLEKYASLYINALK